MILILIGIIAGIIIIIYKSDRSWFNFEDYIINGLFGAVFGFAISFILAGILPMDTYQNKYSFNIESLKDNNNISGDLFLGCGQIDGKMKYVFYYQEEGYYKMMQADYDLVKIKYSNNKPVVHVYEISPTESFINYFAIDFDLFDKTYIIEIPKGTIQNTYKLDAE